MQKSYEYLTLSYPALVQFLTKSSITRNPINIQAYGEVEYQNINFGKMGFETEISKKIRENTDQNNSEYGLRIRTSLRIVKGCFVQVGHTF